MTRQANFILFSIKRDAVLIKDVGPWTECLSVTNDAEAVVARLVRGFVGFRLKPGQRLFYIDSEGSLDEITHEDGCFTGFRPGPGRGYKDWMDKEFPL